MYRIRKQFKVEYAHQLVHAFSRVCSDTIHGHSGIIEIFLKSEELNQDGMVIDFGEVKQLIKEYIDSWDHALVISQDMSEEYIEALQFNKKLKIVNYNPTAENMAKDIFDNVRRLLEPISIRNDHWFKLEKVRIHETDTGYAEYELV